MQRTEEQKLLQSPLKVMLGGKEYEIKPLVMRYSAEWRKKAMPLIGFLIHYTHLSPEEQEQTILELFRTKLDEIIESFFEYARELPRKDVEESATDVEILLAFMEVFNAFVSPLSGAAKQMAQQAVKSSPSEPPLSS